MLEAKGESRAAGREVSHWVKQASGHPARRLKEAARFSLHGRRYYCFRYKRSFFGREWLLAVGGGYLGESTEGCGHAAGGIPYRQASAAADAARLVEARREYWMRRARGIAETEAGPSAEVQQLIDMLAPGNGRHSFTCAVLLDRADFDLHRLRGQLEKDWGWPASAAHIQPAGSMAFDYNGLLAALTLVPEPSVEAQQYSVNSPWEGAQEAARRHTAHLQLAVMGTENAKKTAAGLSQLCAGCLAQPAAAVYAAGTLFDPAAYREEALLLQEGGCPVKNWVYFGTDRGRQGLSAFTYGLEQFGLPEMEITGSRWDCARLEDFLIETARYALRCGRPFHTGEAAGFSREERFPIRRSPGISVDGMSLKIETP